MTHIAEKKTDFETKLAGFADELLSSIITGAIFQICAYTLAKVWLNYLPIAAPLALYYTLVFTLCTAIALDHTNTKLPTSGDRLPDIIKTLKEDFAGFINLIRSPNQPTAQQTFSSSTKALQYLLIATAIYNIPALLSVVLTYLFLSFHFGQVKARTIMNIPLLAASSIFGLLLPFQNSILLLPLIATSAVIAILMYSNLKDFTAKNDILSDKAANALSQTLENLQEELYLANSIDQVMLLTILLGLLAAPLVSALPYLCIISELFTSTSMLCTISLFATVVLGSRLKLFLAPLIDDIEAEKPRDICQEAAELVAASIQNITLSKYTDKANKHV